MPAGTVDGLVVTTTTSLTDNGQPRYMEYMSPVTEDSPSVPNVVYVDEALRVNFGSDAISVNRALNTARCEYEPSTARAKAKHKQSNPQEQSWGVFCARRRCSDIIVTVAGLPQTSVCVFFITP